MRSSTNIISNWGDRDVYIENLQLARRLWSRSSLSKRGDYLDYGGRLCTDTMNLPLYNSEVGLAPPHLMSR